MLHDNPLRSLHEEYARAASRRQPLVSSAERPGAATGQKVAAQIQTIPYGLSDQSAEPACELIASFGEVELEYAAIRRGAAIMDNSHRGTLRITGDVAQRREFLNRMLTQELKDLAPGIARQSFWLNRKGRVIADVLLLELGEDMLIDVDIHQAAETVRSLSEFIVMEDVTIEDVSSKFHHIAIHGPRADHAVSTVAGEASPFAGLEPGQCASIHIQNVRAAIARRDQTGEKGYELVVPRDSAEAVWRAFTAGQTASARPIGWHAYNIARIEAGTPLMNVDFGTTNLPHETGILHQRVSFTKGCYLGQEIVARMEHLGQPKQTLVGLRMKDDLLPTAGEQVFAYADGSMGDEIGVVTSSTLSPMLGAAPIAFAMIKTSHAASGSTVLVNAEGSQTQAIIGPLQFWPPQEKKAP